jgi:two-component system copper resistance phosphate regulon response regulator CusR
MKLLLIEDEERTIEYLCKGLNENGYRVDVARNGLDGLHLATNLGYALILMDLNLPVLDGYTVLGRLRLTNSETPVMCITAHGSVPDRVKGLQLGADDYLVKPFAFSELLARMRSMLRRCRPHAQELLRIGDLEIDDTKRSVRRANKPIMLTAQQYALLLLLAQHAGQVISRGMIAQQVWDMNFDSDTNVVDVAIRRLRCKVDDPFGSKLIHSVRGTGYVLQTQLH